MQANALQHNLWWNFQKGSTDYIIIWMKALQFEQSKQTPTENYREIAISTNYASTHFHSGIFNFSFSMRKTTAVYWSICPVRSLLHKINYLNLLVILLFLVLMCASKSVYYSMVSLNCTICTGRYSKQYIFDIAHNFSNLLLIDNRYKNVSNYSKQSPPWLQIRVSSA